MKGTVIKSISNFLYVEDKNLDLYECSMKGIFRHKNIKPLVGDTVKFEKIETNKGVIYEIEKRKNVLFRPPISNVDQVVIITAIKEPTFSTLLLNRYLFIVEYLNIKPILIFTKKDLLDMNKDEELWNKICSYKKMGYVCFWINNSIKDKEIFSEIQKKLVNKISVFVGQSGAGKSSTINTLFGYEKQKTGKISKALNRGKHTTRISEILNINNAKIIDTPGFSAFEVENIDDINWLARCILPFKNSWQKCKFLNCIHIKEPNCEIKKLIDNNTIPNFFYEDYKKIIIKLLEGDNKKNGK